MLVCEVQGGLESGKTIARETSRRSPRGKGLAGDWPWKGTGEDKVEQSLRCSNVPNVHMMNVL